LLLCRFFYFSELEIDPFTGIYKFPAVISNQQETEKDNKVERLTAHVREAARVAEETSMDREFDAMSWLDLTLEDSPDFFDCCFDTGWEALSEEERRERSAAIRKVL
jgi:4-oxalocrotonate tautomerase